jgi:hypothetical protein
MLIRISTIPVDRKILVRLNHLILCQEIHAYISRCRSKRGDDHPRIRIFKSALPYASQIRQGAKNLISTSIIGPYFIAQKQLSKFIEFDKYISVVF